MAIQCSLDEFDFIFEVNSELFEKSNLSFKWKFFNLCALLKIYFRICSPIEIDFLVTYHAYLHYIYYVNFKYDSFHATNICNKFEN
jgi:hypothetical protein